jgi:hypothetical protein
MHKIEKSFNEVTVFSSFLEIMNHGDIGSCPKCYEKGTFDMRYLEFHFKDSIWYNPNIGWMCMKCWI